MRPRPLGNGLQASTDVLTGVPVGRVVFLSQHVLDSARRAGFHWLAHSFWAKGWEVTFVTTAVSLASKLRRDPRLAAGHPWGTPIELKPRLTMYIEPALIHPFRLDVPVIGRVAERIMAAYGRSVSEELAKRLATTDLVIFESNASLLMFDAVRRATSAKLVYRVSDDVRVIKNSRLVHEAEDRVLDQFDCISVPSQILMERRFGGRPNAMFHPHGVALHVKVTQDWNQLEAGGPHASSLGSTMLDHAFLRLAPFRCPDITFHQIGQMGVSIHAPNLVVHGELPYEQTVALAASSDICLALYEERADNGYLSETSNKLALYMALRKRIVAPEFLRPMLHRPGIFFYDLRDPRTIDAAMAAALAFDPVDVPAVRHWSWDEVRDSLVECAVAT